MTVIAFPGQPWTRKQLLKAYDMASKGMSLRETGPCVGRSPGDVDLMLWAVLCAETVTEALELLNGKGDGGVRSPVVAAE
jgi:hypothetical protein